MTAPFHQLTPPPPHSTLPHTQARSALCIWRLSRGSLKRGWLSNTLYPSPPPAGLRMRSTVYNSWGERLTSEVIRTIVSLMHVELISVYSNKHGLYIHVGGGKLQKGVRYWDHLKRFLLSFQNIKKLLRLGHSTMNDLYFSSILTHTHSGRDHIMSLLTCVRHKDHIALIMPYFKHDRFTVSL